MPRNHGGLAKVPVISLTQALVDWFLSLFQISPIDKCGYVPPIEHCGRQRQSTLGKSGGYSECSLEASMIRSVIYFSLESKVIDQL